jgi:hypothetical protein
MRPFQMIYLRDDKKPTRDNKASVHEFFCEAFSRKDAELKLRQLERKSNIKVLKIIPINYLGVADSESTDE